MCNLYLLKKYKMNSIFHLRFVLTYHQLSPSPRTDPASPASRRCPIPRTCNLDRPQTCDRRTAPPRLAGASASPHRHHDLRIPIVGAGVSPTSPCLARVGRVALPPPRPTNPHRRRGRGRLTGAAASCWSRCVTPPPPPGEPCRRDHLHQGVFLSSYLCLIAVAVMVTLVSPGKLLYTVCHLEFLSPASMKSKMKSLT